MIPVSSLLNPEEETGDPPRPSKKPKMTKDAALFVKHKVQGPIRFRPKEDEYDLETVRKLLEYQVYPLGAVAKYHRHIPYNSGKKQFYEKTGRAAFEGKQRREKAVIKD